jgi:ubiquinone/menaquinone biosynthesis C-methylase UbiE
VKKDTAEALLTLSKEGYNEYAKEFSDSRQYFWRELEFLKNYVQPNTEVLDIGCGNGRLVDMFENINIHYTGIDFSTELIAIAQKTRGAKGTFQHANALSLPFADNTFDTVFSIAVLHHIPGKENRQRFVSEALRVLKPNGTCVLTTWNTLQWKFVKAHLTHGLKKLGGASALDFGDIIIPFGKHKRQRYIHSLSKRNLRNLFEKSGFSDISVQEIKRQSNYSNFVVVAKKQ